MTIVSINNVTTSFGGLVAIDGVDLQIEPGMVFGLIGPNGAGKTTLFNLVTGLLHPTRGTITYDGHDITNLRPDQIAGMGIARTFQNIRLFKTMTALENVLCGQVKLINCGMMSLVPGHQSSRRRAMMEEAEGILDAFGLYGRRDQLAKELPFVDQRRLELARAMVSKPGLLLLDEPAAGMNVEEKKLLLEQISGMKRQGLTVIIVEHDVPTVLKVSDRIAVLNFGKKIAEGSPSEIQHDRRVVEAYLGEE